MAIGMLTALLLNVFFRIGIKKTGSMEFTPGVDPLDALEEFADKQGGIWGARRDVIERAIRAMIETAEALELLDRARHGGAHHHDVRRILARRDDGVSTASRW